MLIDGLLKLLYGVLWIITLPLRVLPNASLPAGLSTNLASVGTYLSPVADLLPIGELLTIFSLLIGIEAGILTYKLIMWFIKRIPGQG